MDAFSRCQIWPLEMPFESFLFIISFSLFKPIASDQTCKLIIKNTGLVVELVVTGVITNHSGSTWEWDVMEAKFFDNKIYWQGSR